VQLDMNNQIKFAGFNHIFCTHFVEKKTVIENNLFQRGIMY